jgi:hypothetical protein
MTDFYQIAKSRGFFESLNILWKFRKTGVKQRTFFQNLKKTGSYYNAFFRVKPFLISKKLIEYKLNLDNEKIIFLTEKGGKIVNKFHEIEKIMI